jgi:septum formation protein
VAVPRLVLASASPARLATLRSAGVEAEVVVSGVAEEGVDAGSPARTAQLLARRKAEAVADRLAGAAALVVGCDSVLELDGRAYGKPASAEDAVQRWRRMRGRAGILHTGHHVIRLPDRAAVGEVASTTVRFADVSDEEIAAYVATGEPLQVAGAFTVDGLGGAFVDGVEGDHHAVVGLSLPLLRRLLAAFGVRWTDLWARTPDG